MFEEHEKFSLVLRLTCLHEDGHSPQGKEFRLEVILKQFVQVRVKDENKGQTVTTQDGKKWHRKF